MHIARTSVTLAALLSFLATASTLLAAPTAEQNARLKAAEAPLKQASLLFKQSKYQEAAEQIKKAQELVAQLAADPGAKSMARNIDQLTARLKKAHTLLELEGIKLPPLPDGLGSTAKGGTAAAQAGQVSFVKEVAPLLVEKCGRCHVTDNKGEFSMASFEALAKGNADGVVVMPGKGSGSRLVEVIESGDMPRGGGTVSKEELALITKWIDQGARFDGPSPVASLVTLVPARMNTEVKIEVSQATGNETVSFATDIGPVLLASCSGCHGGRQPRANLRVDNFPAMLQGGESGAPVLPGKAADSLMIKKIKGLAGDRMPLRQAPLPEDVIARFEKWIAEGAKFDGPDQMMPLAEIVAYAYAKNATHEQLSARRAETAQRQWHLALPDDKPKETDTKHFHLIGNVSDENLNKVGELAEQQVVFLRRILKVPADAPLMKGRMTLFVFRQKFDYSEFGKMVEKRTIPEHWQGHWRFDVIDAYGCINLPRDEEYSLAALVAQQIAAVYVSNVSKVPEWFAEGVGREIASRVGRKDPRVQQWDSRVAPALNSSPKPDAFMTGTLPPEDAAVLSYSFVKFLWSSPKFASVLNSMRQGMPFERAFVQGFGGTPPQLTGAWAAKAMTAKRGR